MRCLFFIFICLITSFCFAGKKPATIILQQATYSYEKNSGGRPVGRMYTFLIRINRADLRIDSIWFGHAPVPCDFYAPKSSQRIQSSTIPGIYRVVANRDLYRNFIQTDSVSVLNWFRAPFRFRGHAVVFYTLEGRREYLIVPSARRVAPKKKR